MFLTLLLLVLFFSFSRVDLKVYLIEDFVPLLELQWNFNYLKYLSSLNVCTFPYLIPSMVKDPLI